MPAPDLTPQQARAVDHRGTSVVLASGAGCGKTHVLTARYLDLLRRDGFAVPEVVAITFTERAAREMRGRIRREVAAATAADPRWKDHLRDLETAPITTIHGFAATLLRRHAAAAGLDPTFDVLDDALSATLRAESLRACLHGLLTEESEAGDDLRELVILFGWVAVQEAIDGFLQDPDPPGWERFLAKEPADAAREWAEDRRRELLPAWVEYLGEAAPKLAGLLRLLRRAEPASPEGLGTAKRLLAEIPRLHLAKDLAAAAEELTELAKVGRTGKQVWGEELYPAIRDAFADFRADLPEKLAAFTADPGKAAEAAIVGRRFARVASSAHAAYRDRKRRANGADFADLLALARDLLRDHPDARAAARDRYRVFLLDELQDTDPVQMELVELLCGGGLHHGTLFAVGDVKQSIYRFRGADVDLFTNLRSAVPAAGRMDLSRNYRSRPGVLGFVNALSAKWFPGEAALEPHREGGGEVEFLWAVAEASGPREGAVAVREAEADAIAVRIRDLLDDPTPRVDAPNGPRRVKAEDVAILFRAMTNVSVYETALRRHGLDYYLVGGRAFFAQQEVYDLLHLLRSVENPQDNLALAGLLRSPFCNLSDEALHLVATHRGGIWAALADPERVALLPADQRPAAERAGRNLRAWRAAKDELPISDLLGKAFADSGYDASTQFEFLGDRKLANLWKLRDLAREFDRTGFGLPAFVARLADQVARQPREEQAATQPENADVVKLMSVHQAKGLEFPVVIVPDLGAATRGPVHPVARWDRRLGPLARLPADVLDDEREAGDVPFSPFPEHLGRTADALADWREGQRVFYVAATRARDLLILSAGLPEDFPEGSPARPPAKAAGPWLFALADRFDLRTGMPLDPGVNVKVRVVNGERGTMNDESKPLPEPPRVDFHSSFIVHHSSLPRVVSLLTLERFARGEAVPSLAAADVEFASVRARLDALPAAEAAFRAALARWDLADPDGWQAALTDHLADAADPTRVADEVTPLFARFAASDLRPKLLAAAECHRDVEFLLGMEAAARTPDCLLTPGKDPLPVLHGLIDFLYRDAAGWHVVAVHLRETSGRDPRADRRPGLALAAWAMREQLGEPPRTVGLLDLVAGEWTAEPAKKLRFPAAFAAVGGWLRAWQVPSEARP